MADGCPIRGTSLYLVLKSNGLHRSKNLPVKFDFSLKTVPANIGKKLPPQRCSKPLFIAFFNFSHKCPTFALTPESGYTHSVFGERSHTAAYTPKQGPSLPRPQCGFVPPAKYLIFRHAFIYIHFPVLCEPSPSAKGENPAKLPPRLYLKPFFNFPHKWPMFAFTSESGYTLAFANRIAHNGTHSETGGVSDGGAIITLDTSCTFTNIPGPGIRKVYFAAFGPWPRVLPKNAESLRSSDALMRVAAPRRRGPAGLRDLFRFCRNRDLYIRRSWFSACARHGWYHYPRCALCAVEIPDGRLSKRLFCRFLRLGSLH